MEEILEYAIALSLNFAYLRTKDRTKVLRKRQEASKLRKTLPQVTQKGGFYEQVYQLVGINALSDR